VASTGVTIVVFDCAGDFGRRGAVDVDLPRPAIELLSQHSGHHIWIKRGSAYRFDFARQTHSFPAFEIDRCGYPIKRCACSSNRRIFSGYINAHAAFLGDIPV